ncbi:MAG: FecR domain-containing protein, partial [Chloroflexi bacterium]|nr:FecR domain-containing protein [Chloroflexota bacterium]
PAKWPQPPPDVEEAKKARALMVYGFFVISPAREVFAAPFLDAVKGVKDVATVASNPLSTEAMETILRRYELSKIDPAQKAITLQDLNKMADARVFQWFLRYGKAETGRTPAGPGLAYIMDGAGATVTRARPEAMPGAMSPGGVIMQHSGHWVEAYGGWRTEEFPPNKPVEVGPYAVQSGKYRAHISFSPDIPASMTASNRNTPMHVAFLHRGLDGASTGSTVANIAVGAGDKPHGEGAQEFTISRPGLLRVRFSMAASHGQAGGYAEHAQSYTGKIEYLGPVEREVAEVCTEVLPGDILRAGERDATIQLSDGTLAVLRARGEMRVEATADGTPRIVVSRGEVRFTRKGEGGGEIEVETAEGTHRIRPQGTDFVVSESGVEVIEGEVGIVGPSATVRLRAGGQLAFKDDQMSEREVEERTPAMAADGIPLEPDYWSPAPEPYGLKPARFRGDGLAEGWLLADPPARWNPPGSTPGPRVGVETPQPGVLRLTVPWNSRLDDRSDTAPRLLHKATGDFDLQGRIWLEGEGAAFAGAQFLVRAPGSYAGALQGQFKGAMADGPGQHYWLGGMCVARTAAEVFRLPALNEPSQARWPQVTEGPVWVR